MPFWLLPVLISYWVIVAICFTQWVFPDPKTRFFPGWWISVQTGGLINLTLLANLFLLAVTLPLALVPGKQSWSDLGWRFRDLPAGVVMGLGIAAAMTLAQMAWVWFGGASPRWEPTWSVSPLAATGAWLGQILGNCLFEETAYRALLIGQLVGLFQGRWDGGGVQEKGRYLGAVFLSQVIFALIHIPVNLANGRPWGFLVAQGATGLIFAWVYLRFDNLFLAVSLHALFNCPVPLVADAPSGSMVVGLGSIGFLLVYEAFSLARSLLQTLAKSGIEGEKCTVPHQDFCP